MRERMEQVGRRVVRDFMPDEHRELFEELPFVIAGSADLNGRLWASLLSGEPGFVRTPTARALVVSAEPLPADPLGDNLRLGAPLGLLGIELPTRRRNRANGRIVRVGGGSFELAVEQSFGNCPKYIHSRAGVFAVPARVEPPERQSAILSDEAQRLLLRTDTTFIATSSVRPEHGGAEGVDVSHRGGRPGFIRIACDGAASLLTMPDFLGNFMFNTLGNLEVNPRAGLLAFDFVGGSALSLSGTARVVWSGAEVEVFAGAERLLQLRVEQGWLWRRVAVGWTGAEPSPHLRGTGTW